MNSINWLHLSDFHFEDVPLSKKANASLLTYLKDSQENLKIDFVVVTGDITGKGKADGYEDAKAFFNSLLDIYPDLGKENIYVVPGNHDVDKNLVEDMLELKNSSNRIEELAQLLNDKDKKSSHFKRFTHYKEFIDSYFGDNLTFDYEDNYFWVKRFNINNVDIGILGLNSAWNCGQKKEKDVDKQAVQEKQEKQEQVFLGLEQVHQAFKRLEELGKVDICIAAFHHPIDESLENDTDKKAVKEALNKRCNFILNGHLHEPQITEGRTLDTEFGIIQAGTSYDNRYEDFSFNIFSINLDNSEPCVTLMKYDKVQNTWIINEGRYNNAPKGILQLAPIPALVPKKIQNNFKTEKMFNIDITLNDLFIEPHYNIFPSDEKKQNNANEDAPCTFYERIIKAIQKKRLLIVESPYGMGKTSLLKYLALESALERKADPTKHYPILLSLSKYEPSLQNFVQEEFKVKISESGKYLFLLDGFDELCLSDETKAKEFLDLKLISWYNTYKNSYFIISTRPNTILEKPTVELLNDIPHLKLSLFDKEQRDLFITKWNKYWHKNDESLLFKPSKDLLDKLKDLIKTPMFLFITAFSYNNWGQKYDGNKTYDGTIRYDGNLNKAKLYSELLNATIHGKVKIDDKYKDKNKKNPLYSLRLIRDGYVDEKGYKRLLQEIAYLTFKNKSEHITLNDLVDNIQDNDLKKVIEKIEKIERKPLKDVFLSYAFQQGDGNGTFTFTHHSMLEFLVACYYKDNPEKENELLNNLSDKKWEEVITFYAGMIDNPSDYVNNLIKPLWKYFIINPTRFPRDLLLAAIFIGENSEIEISAQDKVINLLMAIINVYKDYNILWGFFTDFFSPSYAINVLGKIKSKSSVKILVDLLAKNHVCSQDIIKIIEKSPQNLIQSSQDQLLQTAIYHKDSFVNHEAINILADSVTPSLENILTEMLLNNENEYKIRDTAILILRGGTSTGKKWKSINILKILLKIALEDPDKRLRLSANNAFPYYISSNKEMELLEPLTNALKNNINPELRLNAISALWYCSFSNKVGSAYIEALNDSSPKVRSKASFMLSYSNIIKTSEQREAASKKLFELFNDENLDVTLNAIHTFGRIRKNALLAELEHLLKLLQDDIDYNIRDITTEALGFLKDKRTLPFLKERVNNEKSLLPWSMTIWAILQMEPTYLKTIKENLWELPYILWLFDSNIEKRNDAMITLRKIGTEISLPFLRAIHNSYTDNIKNSESFMYEIRKTINETFYPMSDIEKRVDVESELYNNVCKIESKLRQIDKNIGENEIKKIIEECMIESVSINQS